MASGKTLPKRKKFSLNLKRPKTMSRICINMISSLFLVFFLYKIIEELLLYSNYEVIKNDYQFKKKTTFNRIDIFYLSYLIRKLLV